MSEILIDLATLLLPIIRDILYFVAGLFIFIIVMFNLPNVKRADTKQLRAVVICLIIIWCWVFSRLVVL